MTFDLLGYARAHGLRVRNLHDGLPIPPARPKRVPGQRPAFGGEQGRDLAIVCRHGYVHAEGRQIGWVLLCGTARTCNFRLDQLRQVPGLVVQQEGDSEAAGVAPVAAVADVLAILEPYRRHSARTGRSAADMAAIRRLASLRRIRHFGLLGRVARPGCT